MADVVHIEITPEDEVTIVGYRWLKEHGYGSNTTVWRKVKNKKFAVPIGEGEWTLADIKRYMQQRLSALRG
jgi:hypothetical protein